MRQLRVESRPRLRLLVLAVHDGRRAEGGRDRSEVLSVISRRGSVRIVGTAREKGECLGYSRITALVGEAPH